MNPVRLVLASSSRYRAAQLSQLGLAFDTCSPAVDEASFPGETAPALALRLAEQKAAAVANRFPDSWILAGDQTATCQNQLLTKPGTLANARRQLEHMQGQISEFYSAFCLRTPTGQHLQVVTTKVVMRPLELPIIDRYLAAERVLDCAGSFKVEGLGIALFESIQADDPSALVGLPLIAVAEAFRQFGWQLP